MIELLNKQLEEYLLEYKKVNDEMKALFEQEQISAEYLKELSKKGAGLKMMIEACVREIKHETPTCGKRVLCAENVAKGAKYELTYIPIEWRCPVCNADNSTTLIEEEDLNFSQDNIDKCRKCKRDIKIKASDIFCT